jgi:crotonobetainyl-CoA:carnitine CoA-transferase CaiB-like acyl-CoA transferase
LSGVRVLDASSILAGPLCCQILGDYGADVIKIENPRGGDNLRGHGRAANGVPLWWKEVARNKRTVAIDLHTVQGAELLKRLVAEADVMVENFRPGTLERWGIGPEVLRAINPGLIILRLTGFGQIGPYASRPGFGTLAEAMSGFAHLTGEADGPPTLPAFGLADSICGIAGAAAVTMALRHREVQGGGGQDIDMSILEPIMADRLPPFIGIPARSRPATGTGRPIMRRVTPTVPRMDPGWRFRAAHNALRSVS